MDKTQCQDEFRILSGRTQKLKVAKRRRVCNAAAPALSGRAVTCKAKRHKKDNPQECYWREMSSSPE